MFASFWFSMWSAKYFPVAGAPVIIRNYTQKNRPWAMDCKIGRKMSKIGIEK
jgi:hypothetical protein